MPAIDRDLLRTFLGRRVVTARAGSATVHLGHRMLEATWLTLLGDGVGDPGWLVDQQRLGDEVLDDDGARYHGDDLCTLRVQPRAAPATSHVLADLYLPAVTRVDLYAGQVGPHWVDKAFVLATAGPLSLMISAGTSFVTLAYDAATIDRTLAELADDWPECTLVESWS